MTSRLPRFRKEESYVPPKSDPAHGARSEGCRVNLQDEIIKGLKARFNFKSEKGNWLQQGLCPSCGKKEAYCAASEPKMVKCGRMERCGWEDSVRNLLPDLFEDWSKRFPPTEKDPNAAADAYLQHERGLDLQYLRGSYSQETYHNREVNATSATVRFPLPNDSWWERIIDKPGRFPRKATFKFGSNWKGHWWQGPKVTWEDLATAAEIWLAEGIFDASALNQAFRTRDVKRVAVSLMSVNNWPEQALADLRRAIADSKDPKHRPRLVFAFDVGKAGVDYTRKFVKRAKAEGWDATAAQVRPDGEGTKKDWNDLLLDHFAWNGDKDSAPLSEKLVEQYLWNGAVTIAETAREKANLIVNRYAWSSFEFRHGNRLWWAKSRWDGEEGEKKELRLDVDEIANCAFRLLYRERDEIADETNYFLQIDFPNAQPTQKARFTAAACATSAEFKKRLMAFAGMWAGTGEQLDRIMRGQTRMLKTVEPVNFTGYSPAHGAWVLGDIAVRDGRVVQINSENYFDLGKSAVKLRSSQRMLDINYAQDKLSFDWIDDLYTAWGPRGLVVLAFFTMSLFAVQIRKKHSSLGFLEVTGEPGAGKTTLIEFLWKLMGRGEYEGFDPNKGTVAYTARNFLGVSNLPVGLIEGNREDDRSHTRRFDWNELLVLFNGRNPRGIGAKSSGNEVIEPPFLGSIYLMQNEPVDAIPAVLERIMPVRFDKAEWSDLTKGAAKRIENWPMEDVSGTIVHVTKMEAKFLEFFFDRFNHHDEAMPTRVDGLVNTRCIKNHAQLAAAVEGLRGLFPRIRQEWVDATLQLVDRMALQRQATAGGDHPIVQQFWEKVDWLINREDATAHEQGTSLNQHRDPEKYYAVNLVTFEARCRHAGITAPDLNQLKAHLKSSRSRKFLGAKNVNNPVGKVTHCWVFENRSGGALPI